MVGSGSQWFKCKEGRWGSAYYKHASRAKHPIELKPDPHAQDPLRIMPACLTTYNFYQVGIHVKGK